MDAWGEAIDRWALSLRAAGRSEETIKLRRYQIRRVAIALRPTGPWEVTGEQLVDWLGAQPWGRDTRRLWRAGLRGFYRWALDAGLVTVNPARALPSVRPPEPCPRPTPEDVYQRALTVSVNDERTWLMIRLGAGLGMRRGEVAQLHSTDLEREIGGWVVVVRGKGGRTRRVPVDDALAAAIRRASPAGRDGWVFPGRVGGHLSPRWVGTLVARHMPGAWTMHSLRHRFAAIAHAHERDLVVVQELLGHASIATTRRYVPVRTAALRSTVLAVAAAG